MINENKSISSTDKYDDKSMSLEPVLGIYPAGWTGDRCGVEPKLYYNAIDLEKNPEFELAIKKANAVANTFFGTEYTLSKQGKSNNAIKMVRKLACKLGIITCNRDQYIAAANDLTL